MFNQRTDLPLHKDPSNRFLPWLIAFMIYLATLATAGVMALDGLLSHWQAGVTHTLTVQISPNASEKKTEQVLSASLNLLNRTHGIAHAKAVPHSEIMTLLEPWLGVSDTVESLPLPILIDVELLDGVQINMERLLKDLKKIEPSASIDDHSVWLERVIRLTQSIQILAAAILGFIGFATIGTLIFTTRVGLAVHHSVIEVLHLIGAKDSYIARQFANHALGLGLKGGMIGIALAGPTLLGLGYLSSRLEGMLLPDVTLTWIQWGGLAMLPVLTAFFASITARLTVLGTLKRMT
ncbi:MAG: cell division protein [Rhodospirillales bacterium]|nr:cell division protein [Rhodospirillales bacterium]